MCLHWITYTWKCDPLLRSVCIRHSIHLETFYLWNLGLYFYDWKICQRNVCQNQQISKQLPTAKHKYISTSATGYIHFETENMWRVTTVFSIFMGGIHILSTKDYRFRQILDRIPFCLIVERLLFTNYSYHLYFNLINISIRCTPFSYILEKEWPVYVTHCIRSLSSQHLHPISNLYMNEKISRYPLHPVYIKISDDRRPIYLTRCIWC